MAQRFGGRYSPDGDGTPVQTSVNTPTANTPFRGAKRTKAGARTNFLFLLPLPMAVRAFFYEPIVMATWLLAVGTLMLAAWLTREGLIAQEAYESRKVAKRPAIPRKLFGSALTGVGLALAGLAGHGPVEAGIFALCGIAVHFLAFGPDPMRSKGAEGIDEFQQDRVARAVDEAEKYLAGMGDAIKRAQDRRLEARVETFQIAARDLFRTVEEDPRDLSAARKYLGVYLMGARDATVKFADLYARDQNPGARAEYEALLDDLQDNFAARTRKLLASDKADLDVEIEVLRERLQRDSVVHNKSNGA